MTSASSTCPKPNLMPWPRHATWAGGSVPVSESLIEWTGVSSPRLEREALRLRHLLPGMTVECRTRAPEYPQLGDDESYRLEVSETGTVEVVAAS